MKIIVDSIRLSVDDFDNEAAICIQGHYMNRKIDHCVLINTDRDTMSVFKGLFEVCNWLLEKEKENEIHNRD